MPTWFSPLPSVLTVTAREQHFPGHSLNPSSPPFAAAWHFLPQIFSPDIYPLLFLFSIVSTRVRHPGEQGLACFAHHLVPRVWHILLHSTQRSMGKMNELTHIASPHQAFPDYLLMRWIRQTARGLQSFVGSPLWFWVVPWLCLSGLLGTVTNHTLQMPLTQAVGSWQRSSINDENLLLQLLWTEGLAILRIKKKNWRRIRICNTWLC